MGISLEPVVVEAVAVDGVVPVCSVKKEKSMSQYFNIGLTLEGPMVVFIVISGVVPTGSVVTIEELDEKTVNIRAICT